jgi:hypothetical protein
MDYQNQAKNRFDSLTDKQKLEQATRYIDKYKGGDINALIDLALSSNVAGLLVADANYQF